MESDFGIRLRKRSGLRGYDLDGTAIVGETAGSYLA